MHKIKLKIVDINYDSVVNFVKWINSIYSVDLNSTEPNYVIHSCFGHEVLKYNGIRIANLGENIQPDFNISDYAIGFGRINYADRYLRVPLYRWYFSDYESLFDENRNIIPVDGKEILLNKSRFCTLVVSNGDRESYFEKFMEKLNSYKVADSGGKWQNNIGGPVKDKLPFVASGKFHIAFENSSTPGYVTEKILHAFVSRSIPVYWGAPDVELDFNPKAFINCNNFKSIDEVVDHIKFLDQNDVEYIKMLEQPCFIGGKEPTFLSEDVIKKWIKNIFDQPIEDAYRRNRQFWGKKYQDDLFMVFHSPHKTLLKNTYLSLVKSINKLK